MKILILTMALLAPSLAWASNWVDSSNGKIPPNAWRISNDKEQSEYYLCRAEYKAGLHPGKIREDFEGCRISYDGKEISISEYQVFTTTTTHHPLPGKWIFGYDGWVPENAWRVGYGTSGRPFYLCLTDYHGLQPGKIRLGIGNCEIAYKGKEITQTSYWLFDRS